MDSSKKNDALKRGRKWEGEERKSKKGKRGPMRKAQ